MACCKHKKNYRFHDTVTSEQCINILQPLFEELQKNIFMHTLYEACSNETCLGEMEYRPLKIVPMGDEAGIP
jgi:hypothetical protein